MPTYQYRCKDCGDEFEVVQSFSDDALTTCDDCGGSLRKVFGNIGISFKGSGFYRNDSRKSSASKRSGGSGASAKDSSTDSSSSTDGASSNGKAKEKAESGSTSTTSSSSTSTSTSSSPSGSSTKSA